MGRLVEIAFLSAWMGDYFAAYDPAKAAVLLDEMGLKKGPDGMRLRPDGQPLKIILSDASAPSPCRS